MSLSSISPGRWLRVAAPVLLSLSAACGRSATAPEIIANVPVAPAQLQPLSSQVTRLSGNDVTFSWSSNVMTGGVFHLEIGRTPGASDVLRADVTPAIGTTTYTWTGAKPGTYSWRVISERGAETQTSANGSVTVIDMRDVIEALLFYSGIYSDSGITKPANQFVAWPEGQNVRILTSSEVPDSTRATALVFVNQYNSLRPVSAFTEITSDTLATATSGGFPDGTVGVRIGDASAACGAPASGCAAGGFIGAGGRIRTGLITLNPGPGAAVTGHEFGHIFGFGHIRLPAGSGIPAPMMGPSAGSSTMTALEVEAFKTARDAGLRPGDTVTRGQALGIVK